jgi:hypothetical protein
VSRWVSRVALLVKAYTIKQPIQLNLRCVKQA